MKYFKLRLIIAFGTFLVGIFAVTFWYFNFESSISRTHKQEINEDKSNLENFKNRSLSALNSEELRGLQKNLSKINDESFNFDDLELVAKIPNGENKLNYVSIIGKPLIVIPSNSEIYFEIYNEDGSLINSGTFNAGWRISIEKIEVRFSPEIGRKIIEVTSEPVINGRDIFKQYFALVGNEIRLIRLEDSKGQAVRNDYHAPNMTIGLNITEHSSEEWKTSLKSVDSAEVLSSLTVLSGIHLNPEKLPAFYGEVPYEDIKEAKFIRELNKDNDIKFEIQNLTKSEKVWIKQAATFAKTKVVE